MVVGQTDRRLAPETAEPGHCRAALAPLPTKFDLITHFGEPRRSAARVLPGRWQKETILRSLHTGARTAELNFGDWGTIAVGADSEENTGDHWAPRTHWNRAPPAGETRTDLRVMTSELPTAGIARPPSPLVPFPLRRRRPWQLGCAYCAVRSCRLPVEDRWSWSLNWGEHARFRGSPETALQ